jgi:hypothetical protein
LTTEPGRASPRRALKTEVKDIQARIDRGALRRRPVLFSPARAVRDFMNLRGRLEQLFLDAGGRLYHASAFRPNQIAEINTSSGGWSEPRGNH